MALVSDDQERIAAIQGLIWKRLTHQLRQT